MIPRSIFEQQLPHTVSQIDFPRLADKYSGKVRDCYRLGERRILVTSDRLSAFDRILTTIPFKGMLLNGMASYWFNATKHIVQNHVLAEPHPNVLVTQEVEILPIEVVVRGYLTGSAWRDYEAGNPVSGIQLSKGMKKHQRFDAPIITPSTKAPSGTHDLPISGEEIVASGLLSRKEWEQLSDIAFALFRFGTETAAKRDLILVDTKYEFGWKKGRGGARELVLADEIHTQDSSRYWIAGSYASRFASAEDPEMLDKEYFRRWLIERGYMGEGTPPVIPDTVRIDLALRYAEAFERLTGKVFSAQPGPVTPQIESVLAELCG